MSETGRACLLEAQGLEKAYRMGRVTLPVLRGVSMRIEEGTFMAITGPSGAGKSTLLNLLTGLDVPTKGDVRWQGKSISKLNDAKRASFRNSAVGIVFQFYHLLPELTALENVYLPGIVNGRRNYGSLKKRAKECLERVGLGVRLRHRPHELSGGEQQRVAIARALINEPRVLFCDEPTGNLDSETGKLIAELLVELHRQNRMSLVLVTHEALLAELANSRMIMRDGRIFKER